MALMIGACADYNTSQNVVKVEAQDFAFDPSTISTDAGAMTFEVKNTGEVEHEFEIFAGDKELDEIEGLTPGLTRKLTVTLKAGKYTYVCKLEDHEQRGMKGRLIVI